jgi:hypothetical protein
MIQLPPDSPLHTTAGHRVGKADREAAAAGLPVTAREIVRKPLPVGGRGGGSKKRGRGRGGEDDNDEEEGYKGNRWAAVCCVDCVAP